VAFCLKGQYRRPPSGPAASGVGRSQFVDDLAANDRQATPSDPKTQQFLKLLGAEERSLFSYVYALTMNWEDAEEVMQRVRIRVWQQFDRYDPDKAFGAWTRAIAYYLILAYRKEKNRKREFFSERLLSAISEQFEAASEQSCDRRVILMNCLDKLEDRKRDLLTKYYSSARESAQSLAATIGTTPNALRQQLFRIRKMLLHCVQRNIQAELRSE
jgi:RNA polymerase sigma-70 factor (ECF subfamily)